METRIIKNPIKKALAWELVELKLNLGTYQKVYEGGVAILTKRGLMNF